MSAGVFEDGVRKMLGSQAVNAEKDEIEGSYRTAQTVWGVVMETDTERAFLPERRIQKGASLVAGASFDYGAKTITLNKLQQFRRVMTGWASGLSGLGNELTACDRFLGGKDGQARVRPKLRGTGPAEDEEQQAWEDLWELFEVVRWLSARSDMWEEVFSTGLRDMLPAIERIALPGELQGCIFISSDATTSRIAAIDWTAGVVFRADAKLAKQWVSSAISHEESEQGLGADELAIHIGVMPLCFLRLRKGRGVEKQGGRLCRGQSGRGALATVAEGQGTGWSHSDPCRQHARDPVRLQPAAWVVAYVPQC